MTYLDDDVFLLPVRTLNPFWFHCTKYSGNVVIADFSNYLTTVSDHFDNKQTLHDCVI